MTQEAEDSWGRSGRTSRRAYELADILAYCLSLSNALNLDVSSAVLDKLQTNKHRYPADEFRGRFRRPERKRDCEQ